MQWLPIEKFGNGSDGVLTISGDTTEAPIDSGCSGAASQKELSATNASFAANQIVFIHQTRGTGIGLWELNVIDSYTAGTITLKYDLANTYTESGHTDAQVRVQKQYSSVVVDNTKALTSKAWAGDVGGLLGYMCNGTTTVTGTMTGTGKGHRGSSSTGKNSNTYAYRGGGSLENYNTTQSRNPTGSGAGGGENEVEGDGRRGGGAGGGHAAAGGNGGTVGGGLGGLGGLESGAADLATATFGGGGGGPGLNWEDDNTYWAGNGGGGIAIFSRDLVVTGSILNAGNQGANGQGGTCASGGGAGGFTLMKVETAVLGVDKVTALSGPAGTGGAAAGGAGAAGRIALYYGKSYTGSGDPAFDVTQDDALIIPAGAFLNLII